MNKKILAVIRESTDRQEIDSQKREMRDFCITKGFSEENIVYIEAAGASARKANKKYIEMLENIKTTIMSDPDMNSCAFWHLNRLGRRKEFISMMEAWFVENKIQVYVKEPSITLLNDNGEEDANASISFSVFAAMVELDTKEMFAKMKRGRDEMRLKGKWQGGKCVRYGYRVDNNGYIVPDPDEAKMINDIYKMYASGEWSLPKLARELDARGVTIRGNKWTDSSLHHLIRDKAYIGQLEGRYYEGIVPIELWDEARAVAEGRKTKLHDKTSNGEIHLALKILKCAYCGHSYCYTQNKYWCHSRRTRSRMLNPEMACDEGPAIRANIMDGLLWDVACMCHTSVSFKLKQKSIELYKNDLDICKMKVSKLRDRMDMCTERLKRNVDLYVGGDIDKELFDKNKSKINADKEDIQRDLEKYEAEGRKLSSMIQNLSVTSEKSVELANAARDVSKIDDISMKKELIHRYISHATVKTNEDPDAPYKQVFIYIDSVFDRQFVFKYTPNTKIDWKRIEVLDDTREVSKWIPYISAADVIARMGEESL